MLVTNFQTSPSAGGSSHQPPLTFNVIDDLKLRKLRFFKLIMTKSNFKKSVIEFFLTSLQLRHCKSLPK